MFGALGLIGTIIDHAVCEEKPRPYGLDDILYDLDRESEIDRLEQENRELRTELENIEYLTKEERKKALKKAEKRRMKREIEEAKERLNKILRELE